LVLHSIFYYTYFKDVFNDIANITFLIYLYLAFSCIFELKCGIKLYLKAKASVLIQLENCLAVWRWKCWK